MMKKKMMMIMKKKKLSIKNILAIWQLFGSVLVTRFAPLGMLFVIKTLKDEWYVDIKAYKFIAFEILGLSHIVCP